MYCKRLLVQLVAGAVCCALCWSSVGAQTGVARPLEALEKLSASFESLTQRVAPAVVQILVSGYAVRSGLVSSTSEIVTRERSMRPSGARGCCLGILFTR